MVVLYLHPQQFETQAKYLQSEAKTYGPIASRHVSSGDRAPKERKKNQRSYSFRRGGDRAPKER